MRLAGDAFWDSRRGVWTSSVVKVSSPRRVTDGTILCSRTVPFCLTFLACEMRDIVGPGDLLKVTINANQTLCV